MRTEEIPEAVAVFIQGVAELSRRYNLPVPPLDRDERIPEFEHTYRTGIFRVAAVDGRLAAICSASVRDGIWFLSKFFTTPEHHDKGWSKPLLDQVWQEGVRQGASRFLVWSTQDPAALALYMRLGMLPGTQLFRFSGEPRRQPAVMAAEPLTIEAAAAIDRQVRGAGREMDHRFFLETQGRRGWLVGGLAYVYEQHGWIGPAGWLDDELGPAALAYAASHAEGEVRLTVPGCNHQAIRFALNNGLRVGVPSSHVLMTAPVGQMERYIPSGPELF